jgi:predicted esterase
MRTPFLPLFLAILPALSCAAQTPVPTTAAQVQVSSAPESGSAKKRIEMLKAQPLTVDSIFSGDVFPKIDLLNRDLAEAAVGPIGQTVRFFDGQWNEVTAPKAPGRYGAIVNFTAGGGLTWTQHVTLFKTPQPYYWPLNAYKFSVQLPPALGIPPEVAASENWNVVTAATRAFADAQLNNDYLARLLAALHDISADPKRWQGFSYYYIDRAWWAELGRHLGEDQDYKYLSYIPKNHDPNPKPMPLLLFLHGSGERGSDLQVVKKWGPLTWIEQGHPQPMIVIEPQCPEDEWWDPVRLARLIDQVSAQYKVDPKRIYVTGLSMGGFGSLEFAATYPERVTAVASLSGGEDPGLAPRLKTIPIWFFHGAQDKTVPPSASADLAHALQKIGAPAELTIYPNAGHGKWDVTYGNPALYSWFLSQKK